MYKKISYLLAGFVLLTFLACRSQKIVKVNDNLLGVVLEQKYNSMPMSDRPSAMGTPVATNLFIYKATRIKQLDSLNGHFCSRINGDLIATIQSDAKGSFNAQLQPGIYSVFVQYENAKYIPYFSGSEWTALFEIKENTPTQLEIILRGSTNIQ
jgi:hypothetical protein